MATRYLLAAVTVAGLMCLTGAASAQTKVVPGAPNAEKFGWRLGCQAYSFKRFTFFQAVDKVASLGLKWIEMYPGQTVSKLIKVKTDHNMSPEVMAKVRAKLASAGVKLVNYGVVGLPKDPAAAEKVFAWARKMGVETIVAEPDPKMLGMLDKLCGEYQINLAIHNHPKPSRYWNPDSVVEACKGLSKRVGACADTGHWARSGLDPLECLRKLKGRIISFHLKDLNERARRARDVPWGTGVCNVYAMLREVKAQGVKGVFSIEYEHKSADSLPDLRKCVAYFDLMAAALDEADCKPLLKADLSNAKLRPGAWAFTDGVLSVKGKGKHVGDVWTKKRYGDFVLDLEFKCDEQTNSGVFLRCKSIHEWLHTAIEVQILQQDEANGRHNCGGIFDCLAPTSRRIRKAGQWNHYIIIAKANNIYVILNGAQVLHMDLDLWTEAHKNPDGSRNKFKYAYKDMARSGHIGLQYHGQPIWFRNLKIKEL